MSKLLSVLKYVSFLSVSVFLMWYALRELDFERMWAELKNVNYFWIIVSLLMGVAAFASRAYRWQLQIKPTGYHPSLTNTYHAMMVGYLANLVLPRMGEVARCSILKRTDDLPVNTAFGTVIAERFIDMLMLLIALSLALLFEFDRLRDFFLSSFTDKYNSIEQNLSTLYIFGGLLLVGIVAAAVFVLLFLNRLRSNRFFKRVVAFIKGMLQGVFSITKVDKQAAFWSHTIFVWMMFYGMSLVVLYAMPATSHLSFSAGLSVMVIGSLGMAAPVQGGIGVYHLAVQTTLLLYGVPKEAGMAYALVSHTSQTLLVVLMGGTSFLVTMLRRNTSTDQAVEVNPQTHGYKR